MMNGHQPLLLTLLGAALATVALLVFQPYSADWPGMGAEPEFLMPGPEKLR